MIKYVLIGIIIIYFFYVIYKKVKDMKKGKFCNCGCEKCSIKDKCGSNKNK